MAVSSSYTYLPRPPQNSQTFLATFRDAIDRLILFGNAGITSQQYQEYRIAVDEAYRWVAYRSKWKYYIKQLELPTNLPLLTGTIAYTQSNRTVTLSGATWPSWSLYGLLRINNTNYTVESNPDSATITLPVGNNPGVDIAAGTTFSFFRASYTLPPDYLKMFQPQFLTYLWNCRWVEPGDWFRLTQAFATATFPYYWTVLTEPNNYGAYAIFLYPHPAQVMNIGCLYEAKPRPIITTGYAPTDYTGTVSISGTTVTGSGTSFTAADIGTVLRVSLQTNLVTGVDGRLGLNPFTEQFIITDYASATSVTIDRAPSLTYSGVSYSKSDPLDVTEQMFNAVIERARWVYMKNKPDSQLSLDRYTQIANEAYIAARESDQMAFSGYESSAWAWDRLMTDVNFPAAPSY